jgi:uncharacterized protein
MREFINFSFKKARYRICSKYPDVVKDTIKQCRLTLEKYIEENPEFGVSLEPLKAVQDAPELVKTMCRAGLITRVGPMAAVAGVFAQAAVEAAVDAGDEDVIVENGGDLYLSSHLPASIGLYPGRGPLDGKLALSVMPEEMPLAICSSSSRMGHSRSFGDCDLVTVISLDGALADAAATRACNMVKTGEDIRPAIDTIMDISAIRGILIIKDENIGFAGALPEIVRCTDSEIHSKISADPESDFY